MRQFKSAFKFPGFPLSKVESSNLMVSSSQHFKTGQGAILYYTLTIVVYSETIMKDEEITTIQLKKSVVKQLKDIRKYPRETYNETILNLIKNVKEAKKRRQYDEFLHRVQQAKMKELWDNDEDEAWGDA